MNMSGVNVKKKKFVLVVMSSIFLMSTFGCANIAGSYVGTQTLSLSGSAASSSQTNIIINNASGSAISGSITGTGLTGNFTGSATQAGVISNVMLTATMTGVGAYPQMGGYPQVGAYPQVGYPQVGAYPMTGYPMTGYPMNGSMCGALTFMGNLNVANNQLSGSLTSTGQTTTPGMASYCSGTLSISGSKTH